MAGKRDKDDLVESRRILQRVSQEAESGGQSAIDRAAGRARDHLGAKDVDRADWTEYWGTRIGRSIGALFLVGMIVWLLLYLAKGD
ncbi:MAG: hypothetical protein NTV73_16575 [Hyphomicrobiales bacterium]|nr:hypothetical protein [Hyphomicrobiales bacterium]